MGNGSFEVVGGIVFGESGLEVGEGAERFNGVHKKHYFWIVLWDEI